MFSLLANATGAIRIYDSDDLPFTNTEHIDESLEGLLGLFGLLK